MATRHQSWCFQPDNVVAAHGRTHSTGRSTTFNFSGSRERQNVCRGEPVAYLYSNP